MYCTFVYEIEKRGSKYGLSDGDATGRRDYLDKILEGQSKLASRKITREHTEQGVDVERKVFCGEIDVLRRRKD